MVARAFGLIFGPCILAAFVLPAPPAVWRGHAPDALSFDVMSAGTEVVIIGGTPPAPMRMAFSGTECGIILWGHGPTDSESCVALPGGARGADFFVIGGLRVYLPVRYVARKDWLEYSTDDILVGVVGVCPAAARTWGLVPTYVARCATLTVGRRITPFVDVDCGPSIPAPESVPHAHARAPWIVSACVADVAASSSNNDTSSTLRRPVVFDVLGDEMPAMGDVWQDRSGTGLRTTQQHVVPCTPLPSTPLPTAPRITIPRMPQFIVGNESEPERAFLGGADCAYIATQHPSAALRSCVPCYRTRDAVVYALVVVAVLGSAWASASSGITRAKTHIVAAAVLLASTSLYLAALFGTGAGPVVADTSGLPRAASEIVFATLVLGSAALAVVIARSDNDNKGVVVVGHALRAAVETSIYAAFWYLAHSQTNFFGRALLTFGASMVCCALLCTNAVAATLGRTGGAFALCTAAGLANLANVVFTVLPIAGAFAGSALPTRMLVAATVVTTTGFPALLIGQKKKRTTPTH